GQERGRTARRILDACPPGEDPRPPAAHLRPHLLRSSLTNGRVRSLRYSSVRPDLEHLDRRISRRTFRPRSLGPGREVRRIFDAWPAGEGPRPPAAHLRPHLLRSSVTHWRALPAVL